MTEKTDLPSGDKPGALTPEQQKRAVGAALSKLISATVGDMAVVLSGAPSHKHYSFADIEWMVLPPVLAGQVYIAEAAHNELGTRAPVACVTWAKVSVEVDARLTAGGTAQQLRLRPDEWTSGDIYWLIDMVGDPRGISTALKSLRDGPLKDREVKVAVTDTRGARRVETLATLEAGPKSTMREQR